MLPNATNSNLPSNPEPLPVIPYESNTEKEERGSFLYLTIALMCMLAFVAGAMFNNWERQRMVKAPPPLPPPLPRISTYSAKVQMELTFEPPPLRFRMLPEGEMTLHLGDIISTDEGRRNLAEYLVKEQKNATTRPTIPTAFPIDVEIRQP